MALRSRTEFIAFDTTLREYFETAISQPYPPGCHLKEHGDMAERALQYLYEWFNRDEKNYICSRN